MEVYRLQRSVEDALGQCRTLAFLTNDMPALQTALDQCKVVIETLTSSSTTSMGPKVPQVFHRLSSHTDRKEMIAMSWIQQIKSVGMCITQLEC